MYKQADKKTERINGRLLWMEFKLRIKKIYFYLLFFYLLSVFISFFSSTWESWFNWPAFHVTISVFSILFISSLEIDWSKLLRRLKEYSLNLLIKKLDRKLLKKGLLNLLFYFKNKIKSVSLHDWLKVLVIFIVLALTLFKDLNIWTFLILLYGLISFLFVFRSRWAAVISFFFFILCPIFFLLKNDHLAEIAAIDCYYFLIITALTQLRELDSNRKKLVDNF